MKRRRKRRVPIPAVSLFPFLAVLICTLGVLIILLVVAVKQADVEARQVRESRDEAVATEIATLELELSTHQVVVEGLEQVRPEAVDRMADLRNQRGHFEDEIRRLDDESVRLAKQLVEVESQSALPLQPASSEDDFAELEQKIARARESVSEIRETVKNQQAVVYSIVPHHGSGGTSRRPIYLECKEDGVVFQPHNIKLKREDFALPLLPGNPLDAALLAIREYWTKYDLAGEEGLPYPLIVIRPSGAQNYVLARKAMASWDSEFGYEVVEGDKPLDFGKHDAQLKKIIQQAIADAVKQQSQLAIARNKLQRLQGRMLNRESQNQGLVASGANGGFVSQGGGSNRVSQASFNNEPGQRGEAQQAAATGPEFDSILDHYRGGLKKTSKSGTSQPSLHGSSTATSQPTTAGAKGKTGANPSQSASVGGTNFAGGTNSAGQVQVSSSSATSLANERGQGWALPTQTPGATGFLRPIRVHCGPNAIHIHKTKTERTSIPYNGETQNVVPIMVDHVWQIIDTWGEAGQNGYWKPELRFSVPDSARERFEDLKILLDDSGLVIGELAQ